MEKCGEIVVVGRALGLLGSIDGLNTICGIWPAHDATMASSGQAKTDNFFPQQTALGVQL
jgi:hypothetical protein